MIIIRPTIVNLKNIEKLIGEEIVVTYKIRSFTDDTDSCEKMTLKDAEIVYSAYDGGNFLCLQGIDYGTDFSIKISIDANMEIVSIVHNEKEVYEGQAGWKI